jgi:hypothetical protein
MGDGDARAWVATLEAARKLGANVVCTGHGPRSTGSVLADQQAFFKGLIAQVEKHMASAPPEEAKAQIEPIRASLTADPQIARYVAKPGAGDGFPSQVGKVYEELTGRKLVALAGEPARARHIHARAHGLALA